LTRPSKRKLVERIHNTSTLEEGSSTIYHGITADDKTSSHTRSIKRPRIVWSDNIVDDDATTSILQQPRFTFATYVPTMRRHTRSTKSPRVLTYSVAPPTTSELLGSIENHSAQRKIYRAPYYSKESDVPKRPREYAGLLYQLKGGDALSNLDDWEGSDDLGPITPKHSKAPKLLADEIPGWEYAGVPPSVKLVKQWLNSPEGRDSLRHSSKRRRSQVISIQFSVKYHVY
jgi:hypothetical protein